MSQANRWRWRPDYEGIELSKCRCVSFCISLPACIACFGLFYSMSLTPF